MEQKALVVSQGFLLINGANSANTPCLVDPSYAFVVSEKTVQSVCSKRMIPLMRLS